MRTIAHHDERSNGTSDADTPTIVAEGDVRGRPVRLVWEQGMVHGDIHLLDRVRAHFEDAGTACDLTDPVGFMVALRTVFGERLHFTRTDPS